MIYSQYMPTRRMNDQMKNYSDPKTTPTKKLQTDDVFTNDVKNPIRTEINE